REEIYPSGEQPDAMAGPYRLLHELGRGGSGVVFLAERADDEFHRPVALKLLRYRGAGSERQASLTSERRALARLQHSHIASLFDWGTTSDGSAWLVTEWVDGQPIDVYCREHHLPAAAVVGLLLQVGQAVAYAHDRGIVHRDLKPGNIVVTRNGVAKLLDFGIAREADEAAPPTPQFTPRYASPEQLRGEPAAPPSDIYSLAAVAGELLTGAVPPRLGDVDRELTGVLRRAMDLHPARRYATVTALLEDLRRWQRGLPPLGVAVPWRRRAVLLWRRKRLAVGATAVAVVAIAAGLGLAALRPRTAAAPAPLVHPLAASVTFAPQP